MNYKECAGLLMEQDNILIVTHKNPDGDTMASAAALCSALRRCGKTACLFPNSGVTERLLDYVQEYFAAENFKADYCVAVDVAAENMFCKGFEGHVDLCIDHHPTNSRYADKLLLVEDKASCGEIVLKVIKAMGNSLTEEEATLLYIALTTDCGCFQYGNTSAETLRAGAELIRLGARNTEVSRVFFRTLSRGRMKLEGLIYDSISFHFDEQVAVATVTLDMMERAGANEDDCDDLAGIVGRTGSPLSITIRENADGSSKVSVRSGPSISSSDICAVFGGGGHSMAAGCTIHEPPAKAKEVLLAVVNEVIG